MGQFGDVHIGVCQLTPISKPNQNKDTSSQNSDNESIANETIDSDKNIIHVAVKTCKADADLITSEKFLEEACKLVRFDWKTKKKSHLNFTLFLFDHRNYFIFIFPDIMQKFEHPHIIRLIGICSEPPIWIVMELARLGELRAYLRAHTKKYVFHLGDSVKSNQFL